MKKEYDFSKGERGKFCRPNLRLNLPIYLEEDIADFVGNGRNTPPVRVGMKALVPKARKKD
jgi:hypothetical protein